MDRNSSSLSFVEPSSGIITKNADELLLCLSGRLRIEFQDGSVELAPGELYIVPRGVEHRTSADDEAHVMVFEPIGTRNTGNVEDSKFTTVDVPI